MGILQNASSNIDIFKFFYRLCWFQYRISLTYKVQKMPTGCLEFVVSLEVASCTIVLMSQLSIKQTEVAVIFKK